MLFYNKNKQFKFIFGAIAFIILTISVSSFSLHKYYTSITKVEVDSEEQLLKIYTHVFVDDFEKLLKERYAIEVEDFSKIPLVQKAKIEEYLTRKVKLAVNRSPLEVKLLGCELENELLYLYYQAPFKKKLQRLDIENSLLMDMFTSQQNTVNVTFDNKVKSVHLTLQNSRKTIFF